MTSALENMRLWEVEEAHYMQYCIPRCYMVYRSDKKQREICDAVEDKARGDPYAKPPVQGLDGRNGKIATRKRAELAEAAGAAAEEPAAKRVPYHDFMDNPDDP